MMLIFDNYQTVVGSSDFKIGDLAVFVPPDSILPDKPEYAFLKGHLRIKAVKLRGVVSQGLVLHAPEGATVGQDVADQLGIVHYVPVPGGGSRGSGGGGGHGAPCANPPEAGPTYDIDSWFRYGSLLSDGIHVEITEKLDGANTRASYQDGKFWMGSRNHYRKDDGSGMFWRVFHKNPWLKRLCKQNPGCVIYGETFGNVQALKYGMTNTEAFRVFDIWTGKRFMHWHEKITAMKKAMVPTKWEDLWSLCKDLFNRIVFSDDLRPKPCYNSTPSEDWNDHYVPIIHVGLYKKEDVENYMNGKTLIPGADHQREGIVIKPLEEIWSPEIGRLVLKAVSPEFLMGSK